jgi:hypothetical protein
VLRTARSAPGRRAIPPGRRPGDRRINRDLRAELELGRFRANLHRLTILPLRIPRFASGSGTSRSWPVTISPSSRPGGARLEAAALDALERHSWRDVRELRNEIERLLIYSDEADPIPLDCVADHIRAGPDPSDEPRPLKEIVREVEIETITARLRQNGYSRTATARSLGMGREALWSKMRQLGCSAPSRSRAGRRRAAEPGRKTRAVPAPSTKRDRLLRCPASSGPRVVLSRICPSESRRVRR